MHTRSSAGLGYAVQRVLDAQHENQDAIAEWVLDSVSPKRRRLFERYYRIYLILPPPLLQEINRLWR